MSRSPAPRRRATLASLAAELKVSRTTISNAYNRPDQLSADLRERVLATAKRLGYAGPDPVARSLRTRKAGAVGLVITEPLTYAFSDPAALNFVAGLAESCEEAGQGLLLVAVGPDRSVSDGMNSVLAAGVDGFVVYAAATTTPPTCRRCCSATCRSWSSTSPRMSRAHPGSASTTGPPCGNWPTMSSGSGITKSAC